jgi:hypothetical protein
VTLAFSTTDKLVGGKREDVTGWRYLECSYTVERWFLFRRLRVTQGWAAYDKRRTNINFEAQRYMFRKREYERAAAGHDVNDGQVIVTERPSLSTTAHIAPTNTSGHEDRVTLT